MACWHSSIRNAVLSARDASRAVTLGIACAGCWEATHLFTDADTICWKCGAPSLGAIEPQKRTTVRCRRCDDDYFTAARACGAYEGALRAAVLALKREPNVSQQLLNLLAQTQRRSPLDQATRSLPVPLHPTREKERGFNQASMIGQATCAESEFTV